MDIRPGSTVEGPSGQLITIQRVIGRGGFGQVLAGELPDGTLVAVKTVLTTALSDSELRVFQNELKLARQINHPNVVEVLYVSDGRGHGLPPYLVMALLTGGDLRRLLDDRRTKSARFSPTELKALYQQLASGMRAVNAKLVHRDLKPENILVDGDKGTLMVSDFGLAKLVNAATRSHTFKGWGTPPYMAPEAFDGTANTVAMDIYAMGVMFHELAALDLPIVPKSGDWSPVGWARAHLTQAPTSVRVARPDLPYDLQQLILQMLQKDPIKRPHDWSEILERLRVDRAIAPGTPDINKLIEKATVRFQETTAAEARAQEERVQREERRAILELAAQEPLELLRNVVHAFNDATAVSKLTYVEKGLSAQVSVMGGQQELQFEIQVGDDIETPPDGVVRMLGVARLMPELTTRDARTMSYNPDSFSGFNLAYYVTNAAAKYGSWRQYRFEHNPLGGRSGMARWFALGLHELPRQILTLRALGIYQHQQRVLDDTWIKDLLVQLL